MIKSFSIKLHNPTTKQMDTHNIMRLSIAIHTLIHGHEILPLESTTAIVKSINEFTPLIYGSLNLSSGVLPSVIQLLSMSDYKCKVDINSAK